MLVTRSGNPRTGPGEGLKGPLYGSVRPNIDVPRLVDLSLDGRLKIDQLISRTYTPDQINRETRAPLGG